MRKARHQRLEPCSLQREMSEKSRRGETCWCTSTLQQVSLQKQPKIGDLVRVGCRLYMSIAPRDGRRPIDSCRSVFPNRTQVELPGPNPRGVFLLRGEDPGCPRTTGHRPTPDFVFHQGVDTPPFAPDLGFGPGTMFGHLGDVGDVLVPCLPRRSWALIWRGRTLIWRGLGSQIPRVLRYQELFGASGWFRCLVFT